MTTRLIVVFPRLWIDCESRLRLDVLFRQSPQLFEEDVEGFAELIVGLFAVGADVHCKVPTVAGTESNPAVDNCGPVILFSARLTHKCRQIFVVVVRFHPLLRTAVPQHLGHLDEVDGSQTLWVSADGGT